MAIWLTADTHFNHPRVAESRGFSSVEAHDEAVIRNIRKSVNPTDTLFILGDVGMGGFDLGVGVPMTQLFDREAHLILGNHDRPHPLNGNGHKHLLAWEWFFDSIQLHTMFRHAGLKIMASHFPYEGDRGEDRHVGWRLRDEGHPIVHGHTHSTERLSFTSKGTPQVCVSLDAWGLKPVPLGVVAKMFATLERADG